MTKRIALMTILSVLLGTAAPALAADTGTGTIQGQIINGTAGSAAIADQTVTMTSYLEGTETGTATTKTDAGGKFSFVGRSTDPGYSYELKVTYQQANYTSERVSFSVNETTRLVQLTVYDSTDSSDSVRISAAHTIVYPGDGTLEIMEILEFQNDSDRTYTGSGDFTATGAKRTLKLPLPANASNLQYSGDFLNGPDGLYDTAAVLPGKKTISYAYIVEFKSGTYTLSQEITYPVDAYNFLVQGEDVKPDSDQLTSVGPIQLDANATYNVLSGQSLPKGQVLVIKLSSVGGIDTASGRQQMIIIVLVAVVLIVAGGFAYYMRKRSPQPVTAGGNDEDVRQALLSEIAKLDDDFEGGSIEKESYERLRTEKKALLVRLMQNSPEARSRD